MMEQWIGLILGGLIGLPALAAAWWYRRHSLRQAARYQASERAWRESESHFRMLAENSLDIISRFDLEGRALYVSPACRSLLGYEPQELVGRLVFDFVFSDDLPKLLQAHEDILNHRAQRIIECRMVRKDGGLVWVESTIHSHCDAQGRLQEIFTSSRDLTQRKIAEEALRQSEKRYRRLVEWMPDGLAVIVGGQIVLVNRAGLALVGREQEQEVLGHSPVQFAAPEDREQAQAFLEQADRADVVQPPLLVKVIRPDGSRVQAQCYLIPMDYQGERALMLLVRDVTELLSAQRQLEDHQRLLATLMGNLPGMVYRCQNNLEWTMEYVSPGCRELTGYDAEQLLESRSISFGQLIHPEDRVAIWGTIQRALSRREPYQLNYRLQTAQGTWKWVWERGQGVANDQGDMAYLEGFILDVTQRREVQEALRESEERFRQLVEHIDAIFWLVDVESGRVVYVSPAYEKIMGRSASGILQNRDQFLQYVHPEDRDRFKQWREISPSKRLHGEEIEYRIQRPDGQARWIRSLVFPVYDRKGRVVRLAGMSRDVTEWRQTLATLHATEARYTHAIEAGRMALWTVDLKTNQLYADFMLQRLLAGVKENPGLPVEPWFKFIHPQDFNRVRQAWNDCLQNRTERFEVDFRTQPLAGPSRWMQVRARLIRDEQGQPTQMVGVTTDITDRHEAEEALRQSEDHYRQLAQSNRRLLNEVNHRVRNNLASLLGLITLSRKRAASVDVFAQAIHERIMAMSQTHNLLIEAGWHDLNLRSLLVNLMVSMQRSAPHAIDLTIQGPSVPVNPRQTLPLTMAIAELFTNSCKYGAHRSPQGKLLIQWTSQVESEGVIRVRLNWKETGGPAVQQPIVPSLGTELIEGFIKFELGGTMQLNYPPEGVDHWFEFVAESTHIPPDSESPQPPELPPPEPPETSPSQSESTLSGPG